MRSARRDGSPLQHYRRYARVPRQAKGRRLGGRPGPTRLVGEPREAAGGMTSRMASAGDAASDAQLIAAVRRGNDHAFEQLYRRYNASIARFVASRVRDRGRAEDLVQEIFLSALRRLRATDAKITFRPWIFEIAKNAAIDHYRRMSRAEEVSIHSDDALRPMDQLRLVGRPHMRPENAVLHKEQFDQLRGAFAEL